jgi:hypothetical protein
MTEPKKVEVFKIELTQAEINIVGKGLGNLSYNESAPLLGNIQTQLNKIEAEKKKIKTPGKTGKA